MSKYNKDNKDNKDTTKYNFVIYHRGCYDGFSSFIILDKSGLINEDAIIFPDVPSAKFPPKGIEDKNVIIMDTAYKYDVLKDIFKSAKSVTFIDHHVTIHDDVIRLKEEINSLNNESNIKIIYDEEECGSSLTWKFCFPNNKLPWFLKYIKANDIGKWNMYKNTYNFMAYLNVHFQTELEKSNINKWHTMFNKDVVKYMIKKGRTYKEYIDYIIDQNVNRYSMMLFPSEEIYEEYTEYFKQPGQYKVAVSSCPCPDASQLGNKMVNEIDCDFVIFFAQNLDRREYVLSFRSLEIDVGAIAKIFGGGGHKLASACSLQMSKYSIDDLFMKESLPRQKKQ